MALLIRVLLAAGLLVAAVSAAPQLTAAHPLVPSTLGHSFSKAQDDASTTVAPGQEAHATQNDEETDGAQTEQPQPASPISFSHATRFTRNAQNKEESEEAQTEQPQPASPISLSHATRFTRNAQHEEDTEGAQTEQPQPASPISLSHATRFTRNAQHEENTAEAQTEQPQPASPISFSHATRFTRGAQYEEGYDGTFSEDPSAPAFGADGSDNQDAFSNPPSGSDPDFGSHQGSFGPYDAQPSTFSQDSPYDPSQGQF